MCSISVHLSRGLSVLLAAVAAAMAHGQQTAAAEPTPASVHRMVIVEGGNRRVHYITSGNLSARDRLTASDLERAENELTYLHDLQQLKHQYIKSERSLEPHRRNVQRQLYGTQIRYGDYGSTYAGYVPYGGYGYPGIYGYNVPYWGFSYGGYGYPGAAYATLGSSSYSEAHSLQFGIGYEGRVKDAIVSVIARQFSSEYAAAVKRDYEDAMSRAAASPILSRDLRLPKAETPPKR